MKDTSEKLSAQSIALHWLVAAGMIAMIALGLYMSTYEVYALYPLHKSAGILLFIVIAWRVIARMWNGWPPPAREFARAQFLAARASHWFLIMATLLMPLSGMLMNIAAGRGLEVFGVELLAANLNAAGERVAHSKLLAGIAHDVHMLLGKILIAAIALHFCAAMKHHFVDKDNVLRRMAGKS